jgi:hypothetical protein
MSVCCVYYWRHQVFPSETPSGKFLQSGPSTVVKKNISFIATQLGLCLFQEVRRDRTEWSLNCYTILQFESFWQETDGWNEIPYVKAFGIGYMFLKASGYLIKGLEKGSKVYLSK